MIRFVLRRTLRMAPALIGISLVTFALIHLAPGDPVQAEMAGETSRSELSTEAVEAFRRAYFLDLPLFFNADVRDLPRRVRDLLAGLRDPDGRSRGIREIGRLGGAALPYLLPQIDALPPESLAALIEGLAPVAERMGISGEIARAADPADGWRAFWDEYHLDFKPGRARRLALNLPARENPHAEAELRRLDTFAVGQIVPLLEDRPPDEATLRLVRRLAESTGRRVLYDPAAPFDQRARVLDDWREWWWLHRLEFSAFPHEEHLLGALTETRYAKWLARIVTLDFGVSSRDGRPIADKLREKLPVTLLLSVAAALVAYLLAVPLGVLSALRAGTRSDRILTFGLFLLYAVPSFWLGTLAIRYLCGLGHLDWFPLRGLHGEGWESWPLYRQVADTAHHMVLPVFCLAYGSLAIISRYQRVAMLETLRQDFVRTARAKGLSRTRVVWRHALRNSLVPIVTLLGMQIPALIGGSVVVERIFHIEGMGLETFEAIRSRDYNWILAVSVMSGLLTMAGLLLSDILYAMLDPRMARGVEGETWDRR
ncbi:MAG: ABC transporter permease subunit [Myxococcota bacterium]|nr:ABC transporter permease subunit [Myxococcota bacterium]